MTEQEKQQLAENEQVKEVMALLKEKQGAGSGRICTADQLCRTDGKPAC